MKNYISIKIVLFTLLLCSTQEVFSMFHFPDEFDEEWQVSSNSNNKSPLPNLYISSQIEENPNSPFLYNVKKEFQEIINLPTKSKIIVGCISFGWFLWVASLVWETCVLS